MASQKTRRTTSGVSHSESKFLKAIYQYTLAHEGVYPSDSWLQAEFKFSHQSGVSNVKARLKNKGYLVNKAGGVEFTRKALEYCEAIVRIVVPTRVPIYGKVTAGQINYATTEAIVEEWQMSNPDADVVSIPFEGESKEVFALRVVGRSMEHEHIFEGDIVIVERFGTDGRPRQGELIVTYYLPAADEAAARENPDDIASYMIGPVLKYFYDRPEEQRVILGWRNDRNMSPDTYRIVTRSYNPVGRVIGVYRPIG
jgi:SOS-response transcriptional repressor LexA